MKKFLPAIYAAVMIIGFVLFCNIGSAWADAQHANRKLLVWALVLTLTPLGWIGYNYYKQEKKSDNNKV